MGVYCGDHPMKRKRLKLLCPACQAREDERIKLTMSAGKTLTNLALLSYKTAQPHGCARFVAVPHSDPLQHVRCACQICRHQDRLLAQYDAFCHDHRISDRHTTWEEYLLMCQRKSSCKNESTKKDKKYLFAHANDGSIFYYLRAGCVPYITVCLRSRQVGSTTVHYRGISICHPNDTPHKVTGRAIAHKHAVQAGKDGKSKYSKVSKALIIMLEKYYKLRQIGTDQMNIVAGLPVTLRGFINVFESQISLQEYDVHPNKIERHILGARMRMEDK